MNDTKESVKQPDTRARVSNEQILEMVTNLVEQITSMRTDIEALKRRAGMFDQPVSPHSRVNSNTDPGPWKTPAVIKR